MKQEKPEQENWKNKIEKKGTTKKKKRLNSVAKETTYLMPMWDF